jgi:hypothetical protein
VAAVVAKLIVQIQRPPVDPVVVVEERAVVKQQVEQVQQDKDFQAVQGIPH